MSYPEFLPSGLPDSLVEEWSSLLSSIENTSSDSVKNLLEKTTESVSGKKKLLLRALQYAEAALGDIGDADREPEDDLKWCEDRAAEALPYVRKVLNFFEAKHSGLGFFLPTDKEE